MQGCDETSGHERKHSCRWKDTIGPVQQRAIDANFWGYNQSYGLDSYDRVPPSKKVADTFTYTFPENAVTLLRVRTR